MPTKEFLQQRNEQIVAIEKKLGRLTPDDVIAEAKKAKGTPLHDSFQWDLEAAAMEHWRETARDLIKCVKVLLTTKNHTVLVPRYVHDPSADHKEQGYVSVESLRNDRDSALAMLKYEFQRADSAMQRAEHLAQAVGLTREVKAAAKKVRTARKRVEELIEA